MSASEKKLPIRHRTHETAAAAELAFEACVHSTGLFVTQQKDCHDYGTDVQIEAKQGDAMTNIRIHVQLKGTESPSNADGTVSVSVAHANLNYLLAQRSSLYVCYHLPSKRLLVRLANDVFAEYEHAGRDWQHQSEITVKFSQPFDNDFQNKLHSQVLAYGSTEKERRLKWVATPPKDVPRLVRRDVPNIEVPSNPEEAMEVLQQLYSEHCDDVISASFRQLSAVLDSIPGAMDMAYLAEINLGISGYSVKEDRIREGIIRIEAAAERNEIHPASALYCKANGWLALAEHELAREAFEQAIGHCNGPRLNDVAPQCYKNLGSCYESLGDTKYARECYEKALLINPTLGEAHFALGQWYQTCDHADFTKALTHLDQVHIPSRNAILPSLQGWRVRPLFETGDAISAFREIQSLLAVASEHEWIWPFTALQVAAYGKRSSRTAELARRFWQSYLSVFDGHFTARREKLLCEWLLHESGVDAGMNYEEFKASATELIPDDSDPAFLWDRIGHWAQKEDDWPEAEQCYRKAFEVEPERYGYCLGTALNFNKRYEEALPILMQQAVEHMPDALSWFQVAIATEGVGDRHSAIDAYRKAIELDPNQALAWFNLGGQYWNVGDQQTAAETWKAAIARFPDHELAKKVKSEYPGLLDELGH